MNALTFTVFGIAQPQGSARAFMPKGGRVPVVTSDNQKVKGWRQLVAEAASHALNGKGEQFAGAVGISARFYLPRPKTLGLKAKPHITRPDVDKLCRALGDSLSGVIYRDDSQIVHLEVTKHYAGVGESPRAEITVRSMEEGRLL